MEKVVRKALGLHSKIDADASRLGINDNLFDLGLNSFATVQVMMSIEQDLDLEFPDEMMRRETFATIASIIGSIEAITADA